MTIDGTPAALQAQRTVSAAGAESRIDMAAPSDNTATADRRSRFMISRVSSTPSFSAAGATGAAAAPSARGAGSTASRTGENSGLALLTLNGPARWSADAAG